MPGGLELLTFLASGASGYFRKRSELSAEAAKEQKETFDFYQKEINARQKQAMDLYKLTGDKIFGEQAGLTPDQIAASAPYFQKLAQQKTQPKGEGKEEKPTVGEKVEKLQTVTDRPTGTVTEPILGTGGEVSYDYTQEDRAKAIERAIVELGTMPKEMRDKYLREAGYEPKVTPPSDVEGRQIRARGFKGQVAEFTDIIKQMNFEIKENTDKYGDIIDPELDTKLKDKRGRAKRARRKLRLRNKPYSPDEWKKEIESMETGEGSVFNLDKQDQTILQKYGGVRVQ
jgi:hypothetical protein